MSEKEEFPYREFRPGQRESAEEIVKAVKEGLIVAFRAPTGFGKTSTIIYALRRAGVERVLYLVRTVNEVDPVVRELVRFGEDYTFLYSARRMCPLFQGRNSGSDEDLSVEDFWEACRLARLRGVCPYYKRLNDYDERDLKGVLHEILSNSPRPSRTVRLLRDRLGVCPFFALRKIIPTVRFIVATYPYGFRPDIFASALDPLTYEDLVIVVDEAHTLIGAHQMLMQKITLTRINEAINEVKQYSPHSTMIIELLEKIQKTLKDNTPPRLERPLRLDKRILDWAIPELEVLEDVVEEIREKKLEEALLSSQGLSISKTYTGQILSWLSILSLEGSFLFVEPDNNEENREYRYVSTPMDPSILVKKPLSESKSAVLASGTLPRGEFIKELLGVERNTLYLDTELIAGRFVSRKNLYVAVAKDVTTRYRMRSASMYRKIASYITVISRLLPGLKLVVYPSYDLMKKIAGKLPVDVPAVMEDRSTSISGIREKILLTQDLVINAVAGGKLVEGVEFTGSNGENLLHTVVVVGVPYPQPDAYTTTFLEVLGERLGGAKARYYVYTFQAAVRVLQALGRATRSPEDKAVYFLLDNRYLRRDIREVIGLPIKRVVDSMIGLEYALREARNLLIRS